MWNGFAAWGQREAAGNRDAGVQLCFSPTCPLAVPPYVGIQSPPNQCLKPSQCAAAAEQQAFRGLSQIDLITHCLWSSTACADNERPPLPSPSQLAGLVCLIFPMTKFYVNIDKMRKGKWIDFAQLQSRPVKNSVGAVLSFSSTTLNMSNALDAEDDTHDTDFYICFMLL